MKMRVLAGFLLLCFSTLPAAARTITAVNDSNQLFSFDSAAPSGSFSGPIAITGLVSGDSIHAIDYRSSSGILYGLGINNTAGPDTGRIYTINTTTGVATQVGNPRPVSTLNDGALYGFDFDPVSDQIRVTNSADQNLRFDPDTGELNGVDIPLDLSGANNESITGIAYDRNDRNPGTATTLFGINFQSDSLVRIGGVDGTPSPDGGAVITIGGTGLFALNANIGFDIAEDGVAFASIPVNVAATTTYRFYTINLGTGNAALVGNIGPGTTLIRDISAKPSAVANINSGEFFATIQAAVNDAQTTSGHTITVNAGTFPESVSVTKSLTFLGARAGVDARNTVRGTGETVVAGPGGTSSFNVTVSDVTIDGFTVQDNTSEAQFGAGIVLGAGTTQAKVRNNIIKNNINGLFLSGNSPKIRTVIERNLFVSNNQPGAITGRGIYSDENKSGGTLSNVLINDNTFIGNNTVAVELRSTVAGSQSRVVISNNIMTGSGNAVVVGHLTASMITRNTITGSGGSQIALTGDVDGMTITENVIEGGGSNGIRVLDQYNVDNANITATCNSIEGNTGNGVLIESGSYSGTLIATENWWGSATGPTIASNPGGTGQTLSDPEGHANYSSFLLSGDEQQPIAPGFQCYPSATIFGVDSSNNLVRFVSTSPGSVFNVGPITGLQAGENILGIDFRPSTGELFAIGSNNRLYVISPASATASLRAPLTAAPGDDNPFTVLVGAGYGVSFNPAADQAGTPSLRVVTSGDQNLRINVNNGQVTTDPTITPATLSIDAIAYSNIDYDPGTGTTLFGYDFVGDNFVQATVPTNGTYIVLGLSGVTATGTSRVNFDFQTTASSQNILFASLQVSGTANTTLYLVNFANGLLTPVGDIASGVILSRGLAVAPAGAFEFSAPSYSIGEAGPFATITINRIGGSDGTVAVRVRTTDGTATAPADCASVNEFITFNFGETSRTVNVPIVNDAEDEFNETINLTLSEPAAGALLGTQSTATLTITDDDVVAPTLTTQASPSVALGEAIFDTVSIVGGSAAPLTGTITFKLFGPNDTSCGGAPIFTSTVPVNGNGNYISASFTPTTPGAYYWVATYSGDADHNAAVSSACGAPSQSITATDTVLGNIATRLRVETGDNALIAGFIITGTQPKKVIVRGIGSSLPLADKLADPTLELRDSTGALVDSNDNWQDSANKQAIIDSTIPPSDNLESAIVASLPANNSSYTAILRGANNTTGIGVVEAYDLDRLVNSELANISTRGFVQTGDNVLFAGTIVVGKNLQKVLIRAIGPSLGLANKMNDPTLELRDANGGVVDSNDNWVDSPNKQAIIDTTIPPTNNFESAIVATLNGNNSNYTAIVRGANGTTGIAVVELYALP